MRLAARMNPARLTPVGDGACPVCGGPPAASFLVAGQARMARGSANAGSAGRCGTTFDQCVLCGSTKGIAYREVEGGPGTVKAATCERCRGDGTLNDRRNRCRSDRRRSRFARSRPAGARGRIQSGSGQSVPDRLLEMAAAEPSICGTCLRSTRCCARRPPASPSPVSAASRL